MGSLLVQFRLSGDELDQVQQRAQEHGFENVTDFIKRMVSQLGDTVIEISNAEPMRQRYEGQIELLKEQINDLTNRLAAQSEKSGLNGIERKNVGFEVRLKEEMDKYKAETELATLRKDLAEAIRECDEYENEIRAMEIQLDKMEAEKKSRNNELLQAGLQMLASGKGLQGLFGGAGSAPMGELPEGGEEAQALGTAICQDFPEPDKREALKDVIRFFRDKPKMFDSFVTTKPFQAYLNENN